MKVAILTIDARTDYLNYADTGPVFGPAPTALLEGLAGNPECEVHVVCCTKKPLRSPEQLADNIFYHSLIVPRWGWTRGFYVGCILAVRRRLRQIQPHLVHGQGTERECALAAVFSGFLNVLTIHGNMRLIAKVNRARPFSYQWQSARLERFTLPRSNGVVCVSTYTQRNVKALARATWVVPNAVERAFFAVSGTERVPKQILCVGHIQTRKNQVSFIQALDPLAATQKFQLVFYGGASREDPYAQEFFRLLETRPWCRFAGFADRPTLQAALSEASLLVLPSLEDNCPMVVLEAMAAGVPVVASRVGGIPDLVSHGVDGLLFDPYQPEDIAGAIVTMLQDNGKAQALTTAAKQKAQRYFHPTRVAQRHLEIYEEVINKARVEKDSRIASGKELVT